MTRPDLDAEYRQIREECGLLPRDERVILSVKGPEAADYLQGQLTNDIEAIEPGHGCYAALLDRKGHLQSDMRVLRVSDDEIWVDVEASAADAVFRHLNMYKIGREVSVEKSGRKILSLVGPASLEVLGTSPGDEYRSTPATIAGAECLVVATDLGLDVICGEEDAAAVRTELESRKAVPVSAAAVEILRVESGRPRFGAEMNEKNMPAEAGIVEQAVSFTKGCYIGQEPVARLHYKGSPNRHLRGLRFDGPVSTGDPVRLGDRELGSVGTAVLSPATGSIGIAILRKEAEPGVTVEVGDADSPSSAEVVELPFREEPFA